MKRTRRGGGKTWPIRVSSLVLGGAFLLALYGLLGLSWGQYWQQQQQHLQRTAGTTLKTNAWFASFTHKEEGMREWLKGCKYVYLDVGTNRGVQIRKVFEPHLYPNAKVFPVFEDVFGPDWAQRPHEMCAVGFEPNPANTEALLKLQTAYRQQGWRVHIFTGTAAAIEDGQADLTLDEEAPAVFHQPGSSLVPHEDYDGFAKVQVRTLDLARYINEEVMGGSSSSSESKENRPVVVMKLDLEGYEHIMMPHLVVTGAMCKVHTVFYEEHPWNELKDENGVEDFAFASFFQYFAREHDSKTCPVKFLDLDDESYDTAIRPLPKTKNLRR